jgi:hypothetical protein
MPSRCRLYGSSFLDIMSSDPILQLMPLLLRGLELPNNEIRENVIETLLAAADPNSEDNSLISEHATSLVSIMLKNSTVTNMPSAVCNMSFHWTELIDCRGYEVLHYATLVYCLPSFVTTYCILRKTA